MASALDMMKYLAQTGSASAREIATKTGSDLMSVLYQMDHQWSMTRVKRDPEKKSQKTAHITPTYTMLAEGRRWLKKHES